MATFLCTPGLALSGHTVLRKALSDCSRSCQVFSDPHELLEFYSNCPAPGNSHPKEFMVQMYVPDFSEASMKWLKSSGFAWHELIGMSGSLRKPFQQSLSPLSLSPLMLPWLNKALRGPGLGATPRDPHWRQRTRQWLMCECPQGSLGCWDGWTCPQAADGPPCQAAAPSPASPGARFGHTQGCGRRRLRAKAQV